MNDYEIRVIPKTDDGGEIYWTAFFPAVEGCVGGGRTCEEAVTEAKENLRIFLDYLKENGRSIPVGYRESSYSGKIALRVSRSTHKKLADLADAEGVSTNMLINTVLERHIGKVEKECAAIDTKIDEIRENTAESLRCQKAVAVITKKIWDSVETSDTVNLGGRII